MFARGQFSISHYSKAHLALPGRCDPFVNPPGLLLWRQRCKRLPALACVSSQNCSPTPQLSLFPRLHGVSRDTCTYLAQGPRSRVSAAAVCRALMLLHRVAQLGLCPSTYQSPPDRSGPATRLWPPSCSDTHVLGSQGEQRFTACRPVSPCFVQLSSFS